MRHFFHFFAGRFSGDAGADTNPVAHAATQR
ncbi:hypothetical protein U703_08450 [Rhodobacter capsulatus YW1]|nr:hypothetical protein U703_08450 [Rhodobacter capsulatus YW1]